MFAIFLQEVVAKVAHMSVEAFVLSGVVGSKDGGERRVIAE